MRIKSILINWRGNTGEGLPPTADRRLCSWRARSTVHQRLWRSAAHRLLDAPIDIFRQRNEGREAGLMQPFITRKPFDSFRASRPAQAEQHAHAKNVQQAWLHDVVYRRSGLAQNAHQRNNLVSSRHETGCLVSGGTRCHHFKSRRTCAESLGSTGIVAPWNLFAQHVPYTSPGLVHNTI